MSMTYRGNNINQIISFPLKFFFVAVFCGVVSFFFFFMFFLAEFPAYCTDTPVEQKKIYMVRH